MPEAIPLAAVMMSGTTWKCSKANHLPVRPNPDWTSSKISRMPCLSQISRRPFMKETGGDNIAALAQNRFDQDGSSLLGSSLRGEQIFELLQRIRGGFCFGHLQAEGIRERRDIHAEGSGPKPVR